MKVYDPKNLKYTDKLAQKRHRSLIFKLAIFLLILILAVASIIYFLFFTEVFEITDIRTNGIDKVSKDNFDGLINSRLDEKLLGYIDHQRNILFFDSNDFMADVLEIFSEIKSISINKKIPHTLEIEVKERDIAGVWCFGSASTSGCKYFDDEGAAWGDASRSQGYLILTVDDLRENDSDKIDLVIFEKIKTIRSFLQTNGILTGNFTIPADYFGDFSVSTSRGYDIYFNIDSDTQEQLEVFKIFMASKKSENFSPQHIDLRINGRVYYK